MDYHSPAIQFAQILGRAIRDVEATKVVLVETTLERKDKLPLSASVPYTIGELLNRTIIPPWPPCLA
jgi:hypothetical protein